GRGVAHLPAEDARCLARVLVHHQALLLVVHAEGGGAAALVNELHAEEPAGVGRPVLQILVAKADIAQSLQAHRSAPARIASDLGALYHVPAAAERFLCRWGMGRDAPDMGSHPVASQPGLC